jgi:hypothetical protein
MSDGLNMHERNDSNNSENQHEAGLAVYGPALIIPVMRKTHGPRSSVLLLLPLLLLPPGVDDRTTDNKLDICKLPQSSATVCA